MDNSCANYWSVARLMYSYDKQLLDRYLALVHPLKHYALGKQNRVKRLMLCVSTAAILFSLPRFFEVTTVQLCSDEDICVPSVGEDIWEKVNL